MYRHPLEQISIIIIRVSIETQKASRLGDKNEYLLFET